MVTAKIISAVRDTANIISLSEGYHLSSNNNYCVHGLIHHDRFGLAALWSRDVKLKTMENAFIYALNTYFLVGIAVYKRAQPSGIGSSLSRQALGVDRATGEELQFISEFCAHVWAVTCGETLQTKNVLECLKSWSQPLLRWKRARKGLGTLAHPVCIRPGISGHQSALGTTPQEKWIVRPTHAEVTYVHLPSRCHKILGTPWNWGLGVPSFIMIIGTPSWNYRCVGAK